MKTFPSLITMVSARWSPALRVGCSLRAGYEGRDARAPWIAVPPPGYGGIEQVIALLTDALTERGNDVTLFAAPGTRSRAGCCRRSRARIPTRSRWRSTRSDHVASTFARMEESDPPFDVLHDHCGFTAFAFADRIDTPVLHTLHGPFTEETSPSTRGMRTRRASWRSAATRPSRRPTISTWWR